VAELGVADAVKYIGFADEHAKRELFLETDLLLFPTQYATETFGLVVIEALAFGVPALVSSWRGIPELLPPGSPARNPGRDLDAQLAVLGTIQKTNDPVKLREHYLGAYSMEAFVLNVSKILAEFRDADRKRALS
jgi:glycosyltransferase involved in cell wall biosynthesis